MTSRGLFTENNERLLTEKAKISSTPLCLSFEVSIQVRYVFKNLILELSAHLNILFLQENVKTTSWSPDVPLQEAPDFVNSLSLKVEVQQENTDANPVLAHSSLSAWEFFVSN